MESTSTSWGSQSHRCVLSPGDVMARIEKVNGMSAHADRGELLRWLKGLKTAPEKVFVIHGEEDATAAFSEYVHDRLGWETHVATYQETVTLA